MADMELPQQVEALEVSYKLLPEKDHFFCESLVNQFKEKGGLSQKQVYWVGKMLDSANKVYPGPKADFPHLKTIAVAPGQTVTAKILPESDTEKPSPALDVPVGRSWAFTNNRTMLAILKAELEGGA